MIVQFQLQWTVVGPPSTSKGPKNDFKCTERRHGGARASALCYNSAVISQMKGFV